MTVALYTNNRDFQCNSLKARPEPAHLIFPSKQKGTQAVSGKVMYSECMNESKGKEPMDKSHSRRVINDLTPPWLYIIVFYF